MRQTKWPEVEEVWCAAATAAADVDGNGYRAGGQSGSVVTLELSFYFPVAWGSNNIRRSITVLGGMLHNCISNGFGFCGNGYPRRGRPSVGAEIFRYRTAQPEILRRIVLGGLVRLVGAILTA